MHLVVFMWDTLFVVALTIYHGRVLVFWWLKHTHTQTHKHTNTQTHTCAHLSKAQLNGLFRVSLTGVQGRLGWLGVGQAGAAQGATRLSGVREGVPPTWPPHQAHAHAHGRTAL